MVCRSPERPTPVRIERRLEGGSAVEFQTIELRPGQDHCAQLRDIIPPGALGTGQFKYEVRVTSDSGAIASRSREFTATAAGAQHGRPGS